MIFLITIIILIDAIMIPWGINMIKTAKKIRNKERKEHLRLTPDHLELNGYSMIIYAILMTLIVIFIH